MAKRSSGIFRYLIYSKKKGRGLAHPFLSLQM